MTPTKINIPSMIASLTEFHQTFGLDIGTSLDNRKCRNLRLNLIQEELRELEEHLEELDRYNKDPFTNPVDHVKFKREIIAQIADDLGDIAYVVVGTAVSFGWELYEEKSSYELVSLKVLFMDYSAFYFGLYDVEELSSKPSKALSMMLAGVLKMANQFSLNLQVIFDAIHKSNMSKLWLESKVWQKPDDCECKQTTKVDEYGCSLYIVRRISDGKIIKSPSYSPFVFDPATMMLERK